MDSAFATLASLHPLRKLYTQLIYQDSEVIAILSVIFHKIILASARERGASRHQILLLKARYAYDVEVCFSPRRAEDIMQNVVNHLEHSVHDHDDYIDALVIYPLCLYLNYKLDEATVVMEEAFVCLRKWSEVRAGLWASIHDISSQLHFTRGNKGAAELHLWEALKCAVLCWGWTDPNTTAYLIDLEDLLIQKGRSDVADVLYRRRTGVLESCDVVFGPTF